MTNPADLTTEAHRVTDREMMPSNAVVIGTLKFSNTTKTYTRAHMCGRFVDMVKLPSCRISPVCRVHLELSKQTYRQPDIGQSTERPHICIYAIKLANQILRASKRRDLITIPHMEFVFFSPQTMPARSGKTDGSPLNARI